MTPSHPYIHVAIADCHTLQREILGSFINSLGNYTTVIEAASGKEFIEKIELSEQKPDICILDIDMPQMEGFDTLIKLKKISPTTKILILTLFGNEYTVIKMIQQGVNGFLLKGCTATELKNALSEIHANDYYFSDTLKPDIVKSVKKGKLVIPSITEREKQFLMFNYTGLDYHQIADKMGISIKTINSYREALCSKLKVSNRIGLVIFSIKAGFIHMR